MKEDQTRAEPRITMATRAELRPTIIRETHAIKQRKDHPEKPLRVVLTDSILTRRQGTSLGHQREKIGTKDSHVRRQALQGKPIEIFPVTTSATKINIKALTSLTGAQGRNLHVQKRRAATETFPMKDLKNVRNPRT